MVEEVKMEKSELELLLEKNAYGEGLTNEEHLKAQRLIADPVYSEENCWVCKMSCPDNVDKAIYDTGLCQDHARYALVTRK